MNNNALELPTDSKDKTVQALSQKAPDWLIELSDKIHVQLSKQIAFDEESHYQAFIGRTVNGSLNIGIAGWHLKQCHELRGRQFLVQKAKDSQKSLRALYNYIDVYEVLQRAADKGGVALVQALSQIDHTKLMLLKPFDDTELSDFLDGEQVKGITLDDLQIFPLREAERRIKESPTSESQSDQRFAKERKARELAEEEVRLLKKKGHEVEGFLYPDSIERVRIESAVLSSQVLACFDDMEQFITLLVRTDDLDHDLDKRNAQFSAGSSTLFVNIAAAYGKARHLLDVFDQLIGVEGMSIVPEDTPLLSDDEMQRIIGMREVMLIERTTDADVRERGRKSKRARK